MIFSSIFLHAVTFSNVFHPDVVRSQIELKTESENLNFLMYGYNAEQPIAIPTYTSKLKILQIIIWNIGMAQKTKETRSGCLVHIVQ